MTFVFFVDIRCFVPITVALLTSPSLHIWAQYCVCRPLAWPTRRKGQFAQIYFLTLFLPFCLLWTRFTTLHWLSRAQGAVMKLLSFIYLYCAGASLKPIWVNCHWGYHESMNLNVHQHPSALIKCCYKMLGSQFQQEEWLKYSGLEKVCCLEKFLGSFWVAPDVWCHVPTGKATETNQVCPPTCFSPDSKCGCLSRRSWLLFLCLVSSPQLFRSRFQIRSR